MPKGHGAQRFLIAVKQAKARVGIGRFHLCQRQVVPDHRDVGIRQIVGERLGIPVVRPQHRFIAGIGR